MIADLGNVSGRGVVALLIYACIIGIMIGACAIWACDQRKDAFEEPWYKQDEEGPVE